ncbi:Ankrd28, partial [Symbiodinium sp. KB8]
MAYSGYSGMGKEDSPSLAVRLMQVAGEFELEKKRETQKFLDTIHDLEKDKMRLEQKNWEQGKEIDRLHRKLNEAYGMIKEMKSASSDSNDGIKRELIALRFEYADRVNQLSRWRRARKLGKPILGDASPSLNQENTHPNDTSFEMKEAEEEMKAAALEAIAAGETKGDIYSREMLYVASEEGLEEMVSSILNPQPTSISSDIAEVLGEAFRRACSRNNESIARMLLTFGASPNVRSSHDHLAQMPIHAAAEQGSDALVRLLASIDVTDVNDRDAYLRTPLHLASKHGHTTIVKFLLLNGANSDLKDDSGFTPLEVAKAAGEKARGCIDVLQDPHVMFWNSSVRANKLYNDKNFQGAIDMYSRALDLAPQCSADATYRNALAQRAECYMGLLDSMPDDRQWVRRLDDAIAMRDMTHYQVLGIPVDASPSQIKKGYRQQCLKWHPDKHTRSEEAIGTAYETLSDERKRRMYDLEIRLRYADSRRAADGFDRWYSKEMAREAERAKEREVAQRAEAESEAKLFEMLRSHREKHRAAVEAKERRNARHAKVKKAHSTTPGSPQQQQPVKAPPHMASPSTPTTTAAEPPPRPSPRRVIPSPVSLEKVNEGAKADAAADTDSGDSTPTASVAAGEDPAVSPSTAGPSDGNNAKGGKSSSSSRTLAEEMKERMAARRQRLQDLERRAKSAVAAGEAARSASKHASPRYGGRSSMFEGDPDAEELGLTGMSFSDLEAENDAEGEDIAARLKATLERATAHRAARERGER